MPSLSAAMEIYYTPEVYSLAGEVAYASNLIEMLVCYLVGVDEHAVVAAFYSMSMSIKSEPKLPKNAKTGGKKSPKSLF